MTQNLKSSKLSVAVAKAGATGFQVDTTHDNELFNLNDHSWDELNILKEQLGHGVLEFTAQVSAIVQNPDITNHLGDQVKHFTDTVNLFFKEITDFSERVRQIRVLHEEKHGAVTNMDEFSLYNRVAMNYHALCNELAILITPIVSELMMIVSKVVDNAKVGEPQVIQVEENHE